MRIPALFPLAPCLALAVSCTQATSPPQAPSSNPSSPGSNAAVAVELRNAAGTLVGTARLTRTSALPTPVLSPSPGPLESGSPTPSLGPVTDGVRFEVSVKGLVPGSHGMAIHGAGLCEPPDFSSSGPHFNPSGREHGFENPAGPHAGDLPNMPVGTDGQGAAVFVTNLVSLDPSAPNSLLSGDGTSLVIHEHADDEVSNPAGGSGQRIACGVIGRGQPPTPSPGPSPSMMDSPGPSVTPTLSSPAPSSSP